MKKPTPELFDVTHPIGAEEEIRAFIEKNRATEGTHDAKNSDPSITILPALGTDGEMESLVDHLIEHCHDLHGADAKKVLKHEGPEKLPSAWFSSN